MQLFGELFDRSEADKICQELNSKGIQTQMDIRPGDGLISLFVVNDTDAEFAFDYYRVRMGIGKPSHFTQEEIEAWSQIKSVPLGQMTVAFGIISCLCYIVLATGMRDTLIDSFFISSSEQGFLKEVMAGEVWRLVTPIFLHFSFLHILFNMMWLKDLGSLYEHVFGVKNYLIFILVVGIFSNLLQYSVWGFRFGGMSGVIYGLLGVLWMLKEFDPEFEYGLPKNDVWLMIGWFFFCLTGLLGPIANLAHAGGLTAGMFIGLFFAYKRTKHLQTKMLMYSVLALFLIGLTYVIDIYVKGNT